MLSSSNLFNGIKLTLLLFIPLCLSSCNDNVKSDNNDFTVDFTAKYKNKTNSFIINPDGKTLVLVKEIYKVDKFNKVVFSRDEMVYIQKTLKELNLLKCDTINKNYIDGLQYVFCIKNNSIKKQLIGGSCEELKPLDKLASFIIKTYAKKQKEEYFESLKIITPPKLPSK